MKRILRFLSVIIVTGTILLALCADSAAQRNPTMPSQMSDTEREKLYAKFTENKKLPIPEKQRLAYEAARDYIHRFDDSTDRYIPELQRFVTAYEKTIRRYELYTFYSAKNYSKAFELGHSLLQTDPENFYVLAVLTEVALDSSQTGNATYNEEAINYASKAIELLSSEKLEQTDPFANKEIGRGVLNFALGWFLRTKSPTEAAAAFVIAATAGSDFKTNALTYNLLGNAILKGEYAKLSVEYNEKFGNKLSSPEQEAMLAQIVHLGERAIDAYARAVALTTNPEQLEGRTKMLAQLTNLYKSFHNNSDEGLAELIANVLSKPLP